MSTMHQQQVIMWLGVELAEKKSRIVDLENENQQLRHALEHALANTRVEPWLGEEGSD
ncbi:MAG: hypothetical protein WKF67_13065 [Rubrobacteraceae bacterium]